MSSPASPAPPSDTSIDDDYELFEDTSLDFDLNIRDFSLMGFLDTALPLDINTGLKKIKSSLSSLGKSPSKGRRKRILKWLNAHQNVILKDKISFVFGK